MRPIMRQPFQIHWNWFLYGGLFLLIAAHFSLNFAKTGTYFLNIEQFSNGQAEIPFQYRVLTAPLFKVLMNLFGSVDLSKILHSPPWYLLSPEALSFFVVNSISYFFALFFFVLIAEKTFESKGDVIFVSSVFVIMTYFIFILNPERLQFILPYDLPSLAFMQICILLVLLRKWVWLCVIFTIATMNRETTFLIIFFIVIRALTKSEERRTSIIVASCLSLLWIIDKSVLFFFFRGAKSAAEVGGIAAFKLFDNVIILLKPWQWPAIFSLVLPMMLSVYFLCKKPSREALNWLIPSIIGFGMLLFVANISEQRAFGDLNGFLAMSLMFFFKEKNIFSSKYAS